ncbi:MAG: STAS domain-containing protein [Desulfobulbaceae bacterium]|nr:STAS domain-containing protein [Desulfobulbaceae bacterium]
MDITSLIDESGGAVLKITGQLVASNVEQLWPAVNALAGGVQRIYLDLAGLEFIDSSGLKTCMQLQNQLRAGGGGLCCFNLSPAVLKVFTVTGADQKIPVLASPSGPTDLAGPATERPEPLRLILAPLFIEVDAARRRLEEVGRAYYPGAAARELFGEVLLAVTEALNNVVEHGRASRMELTLTARPERLELVVASDGRPFDPTADVAMPVLDGEAELPEGGFGRALILELMDEVRYEFKDGKNVLKLSKKMVS